MDPDANLREQLLLAQSIALSLDRGDDNFEWLAMESQRLTELVLSLDSWLQNGGAMPKRWKR